MKRKGAVEKGGRGDEQGQAMVEFAITIPIIIITLIAVVGFAWILYSYVSLNSAVREGAHLCITEYSYFKDHLDEVEDMVQNSAGMLNPEQIEANVDPPDPDELKKPEGDRTVTVYATYTVALPRITIPYIITEGSVTLLGPLQLRAESKMEIP